MIAPALDESDRSGGQAGGREGWRSGPGAQAAQAAPRRVSRILIATDAWFPQVNGAFRTIERILAELRRMGVDAQVLTPEHFPTVPCPGYRQIRLALPGAARTASVIDAFKPDVVHLATEGPIGWRVRSLAQRRGLPLTTSFHTRFPEYLRQRAPVPEAVTYAVLRRFHGAGSACLVPSRAMRADLEALGFRNLVTWSRGVDTELFRPRAPIDLGLPRPIFLTVGRVAPEKNLEAFLRLPLPGSKVVVGDGPLLPRLRERYPDVFFAGVQSGEMLARYYSTADVFVFPSRSDTFGLVLLEAMACGTPVAAYPEPGPLDVVAGSDGGIVSTDLEAAALAALNLRGSGPTAQAARFGWESVAATFLAATERALRQTAQR